MRCYTVVEGLEIEGISTYQDSILVGQEGRGRKLVKSPIPSNALIKDDRLLEVPCNLPATVVVLVKDHSGFRGSWKIRDAWTNEAWDVHVSRISAHRPPDGSGGLASGHVLKVYQQACPACDSIGPEPIDHDAEWHIICEGFCAQGDAGRMGGGPEYLALLHDGTAVEIVRMGRLYGGSKVIKVANEGGKLILSDPKQDAESRKALKGWDSV